MDFRLELMETIRSAMLSATQRVGGAVLWRASVPPKECRTFTVDTVGEPRLTMIFQVEPALMRQLANHMAHGPVEAWRDVMMYNQELFNILCGTVISRLNTRYQSHARFKIPAPDLDSRDHGEKQAAFESCWQSSAGRVSVRGYFDEEEPFFQRLKTASKGVEDMSKKVMVVDDSLFIFEELKYLTKDTEFDLSVFCRDGESALERYGEVLPDLVTMDIILPGMDGLETLRAIMARWPDARVLVISSLAFEDTMTEAREGGARGFLSKPFDREEVLRVFREALE